MLSDFAQTKNLDKPFQFHSMPENSKESSNTGNNIVYFIHFTHSYLNWTDWLCFCHIFLKKPFDLGRKLKTISKLYFETGKVGFFCSLENASRSLQWEEIRAVPGERYQAPSLLSLNINSNIVERIPLFSAVSLQNTPSNSLSMHSITSTKPQLCCRCSFRAWITLNKQSKL